MLFFGMPQPTKTTLTVLLQLPPPDTTIHTRLKTQTAEEVRMIVRKSSDVRGYGFTKLSSLFLPHPALTGLRRRRDRRRTRREGEGEGRSIIEVDGSGF